MPVPRACGAVEKPPGGIDLVKNDNHPVLIPIMNKLLVAALRCDRTRMASMQYSRSFSKHRSPGSGMKDGHHTHLAQPGPRSRSSAHPQWYRRGSAI